MHLPIEVFISYSHKDRHLLNKLLAHLSNLRQQHIISYWHDGAIIPGTAWEKQIMVQLKQSQLILLIVSADFMHSTFCSSIELQEAMARHHANQARVIPILARPTDWEAAPFAALQVLPTNGKFITEWTRQDSAFTDVVQGIKRTIEDIQAYSNHYTVQTSIPTGDAQSASLWYVPYRRNPFFTGQETLLTQLHDKLHTEKNASGTQLQAISGLGGIGKTQIAIEYAYRYRDEYPAVFWVQADTQEAIILGYLTLARLLHLSECEAKDQTIIVEAVKHWLYTHTDWLLILDNVDEISTTQIYLPLTCPGHILLTTRAHTLGPLADSIRVETMNADEGSLLLLRRARVLAPNDQLERAILSDRSAAYKLVITLGGLPLALDQAGAYIEETNCGLVSYLYRYQTHRTILLKRRGTLVTDHPDSVSTTWSLTFSTVESINPSAADLLRLCAFLYPNAIPEEFFSEETKAIPTKLRALAQNPVELDEAVRLLHRYSLISRNIQTMTLSIHPLVQVVQRDTMTDKDQRQWATRAVRVVNSLFPFVEYTTWTLCERYILNAQNCLLLIQQWKITSPEAARLFNQAGSYLSDHAEFADAELFLQQALAIHEQVYGPNHPNTALSLNNLASLYVTQGKYAQAEPLLQRALTICEQASGPNHPDTARSLNDLASFYWHQGKYAQAKPLLQRALTIYEQELGPEHVDIATILNNLAILYSDESKYAEAETLYLRALAIRQDVFGPNHPDTADLLNSFAGLYWKLDRYAEAEPLLQQTLAISEQIWGPNHPNVSLKLNNLGELYEAQGKYKEAEPLFQRALAIREQVLGPNHPDTAGILNNLAGLFSEMGKYTEAEPLYQRALAIRERVLESDHPDITYSLNSLAELYRKQCKYTEAEPLYQRALAIREQVLGPNHPDTATILHNLAALYDDQGQYKEAEPLYQRALAIHEQVLGPSHSSTADNLNNLAALYWNQGKYKEAEPLYQRALAIREQVLGNSHPDTADVLNNLAALYWHQGKYKEAEPLLLRALAISEQAQGFDHPAIASSLNNLAVLYGNQGRQTEAEALFYRALAISKQKFTPDHSDTATTLNNLASLYRDQGKYKEAEPLYQQALMIHEQILGSNHPTTANTLNNLAELYRKQGQYSKAELLYKRALIIFEQTVGPNHSNTAAVLNNLALVYEVQGQYAKAKPLYQRTLAICEQVLGFNHPNTAKVRKNYTHFIQHTQNKRTVSKRSKQKRRS